MTTDPRATSEAMPRRMRAVRLHRPAGVSGLAVDEIEVPEPGPGEALVRVHAAAITRDELGWPVDRLPAIPSYELSGVVAGVGPGVDAPAVGDAVFALIPFDRDGAAAEFVTTPAANLAPKPATASHVEAAALPLAGLSAWQGLFVHGGLEAGQRVLIHGATGGVGHLAVQLARWKGAHVVGTASHAGGGEAAAGSVQLVDRSTTRFEDVVEPVHVVFDTVGGDVLARSPAVLGRGGRLVSVAEEPPGGVPGIYFVVEPDRDQLIELARLVDAGSVRAAVDSVFSLADAVEAFEHLMAPRKRGKVVIDVRG